MSSIKKIKLKYKLIMLFSLLTVLIASGLAFGISAMKNNHISYLYLLDHPSKRIEYFSETKYSTMVMRRAFIAFYLHGEKQDLIIESYNEAFEYFNVAVQNLEFALDNVNNDPKLSIEEKKQYQENIQAIIEDINFYMNSFVIPSYDLAMETNNIEEIKDFIEENIKKATIYSNSIIGNLEKLTLTAKNRLSDTTNIAFNAANLLMIQMNVLFSVVMISVIILFFIISHEVASPIKRFIEKILKNDYVNLSHEEKQEINSLIKHILD